jgi:hypothetical protein
MALKNSSANYFRKFKRLQLTFQVVCRTDAPLFNASRTAALVSQFRTAASLRRTRPREDLAKGGQVRQADPNLSSATGS